MKIKHYQVCIVGGGVTGTALAYVLSHFANVKNIVLLEKNKWVAEVNSHPLNNAQTSHDGSTETNYDLEHALKVKKSATALRRYVDGKKDQTLSRKVRRMVLAVNSEEVAKLESRFKEFKPHYPDLWMADLFKLSLIDPNLLIDRDLRKDPISAMGSDEGYIVNYQKLAEHFVNDALTNNPRIDIRFN